MGGFDEAGNFNCPIKSRGETVKRTREDLRVPIFYLAIGGSAVRRFITEWSIELDPWLSADAIAIGTAEPCPRFDVQ
jgi:hypothetical protein